MSSSTPLYPTSLFGFQLWWSKNSILPFKLFTSNCWVCWSGSSSPVEKSFFPKSAAAAIQKPDDLAPLTAAQPGAPHVGSGECLLQPPMGCERGSPESYGAVPALSSHLLISPSEIFMALKRRAGAVPQGSEAPVGWKGLCWNSRTVRRRHLQAPEVHEVCACVCARVWVCDLLHLQSEKWERPLWERIYCEPKKKGKSNRDGSIIIK